MAKDKKPWWEDDNLSYEGSCAVCKSCRIHKLSGTCMYGSKKFGIICGPYAGYVKVEDGTTGTRTTKEGSKTAEEEGRGSTEGTEQRDV